MPRVGKMSLSSGEDEQLIRSRGLYSPKSRSPSQKLQQCLFPGGIVVGLDTYQLPLLDDECEGPEPRGGVLHTGMPQPRLPMMQSEEIDVLGHDVENGVDEGGPDALSLVRSM